MHRFLRTVLVIIGILSLILAAVLYFTLPGTTSIWPWAATSLPYSFLSSIIAATGAAILWISLSGELGTAVGGAIDLGVFYIGMAISLFILFQTSGDQRFLIGTLLAVIGILVAVGIFVWFRRYPIRGNQRIPQLVRISFGVFAGILLLVGTAVLLQVPNAFAWKLSPADSVLIGCFFLGSACYFAYGLLRPVWSSVYGQLWAFLAYDIVLIVPYLQHYAVASPAQMPSLIINTGVMIYSGALAIYYLLVNKKTRTWGRSSEVVNNHEVDGRRGMTAG